MKTSEMILFYMPTWDNLIANMVREAGHDLTIDPGDDFDCALLSGGPDVDPRIYGEEPIPGTSPDFRRSLKEVAFLTGRAAALPKVGICYGGQLLNCISGGRMWQDVTGHAIQGTHIIKTGAGILLEASSTHHQMMRPGAGAVVLATARQSTSKVAQNEKWLLEGDGKNDWDDAEVIWYKDTSSLCFQPHPEYKSGEGCRGYFFGLVNTYILPLVQRRKGSSDNFKGKLN